MGSDKYTETVHGGEDNRASSRQTGLGSMAKQDGDDSVSPY